MIKLLFAVSTNVRLGVCRMIKETGLKLDRYGSQLSNDIAYLEPLSRHRQIMPLFGCVPAIYDTASLRDNCTIIGEVVLGDYTTVGYGAVLRADDATIRVGQHASIGDNVVIEVNANRLPTGVPYSVLIGQRTKIGDGAVLKSCIIDDDVVVGERSLILDGSQLERGCVIAPDSVVPPGRLIPSGQLWAGNPAVFVKDLKVIQKKTQYQQENQQIE